jgi:putative spermidine/putrescine transport system ATP-binding protein
VGFFGVVNPCSVSSPVHGTYPKDLRHQDGKGPTERAPPEGPTGRLTPLVEPLRGASAARLTGRRALSMASTHALAFESLRKEFGGLPALCAADCALEEGEHLAVMGPSGSGKTTLLRIIAGLIEPTAGRVLERGQVVNQPGRRVPPHQRGIGMVFQGLGLWPHLTVRGHVEFAGAALACTRAERRKQVHEVLGQTGLASLASRYPSELSGGEKQRVAFARAIAGAPRLLLLDEPLTSLDPVLREDLLVLVESHGKVPGRTSIIATHDAPVARRVGRRVLSLLPARGPQVFSGAFSGEHLCNPGTP